MRMDSYYTPSLVQTALFIVPASAAKEKRRNRLEIWVTSVNKDRGRRIVVCRKAMASGCDEGNDGSV